jgi:phosphohistidine phosphatase
MRRLFLVRHAKAKPAVGRDDYARKLTKRGRADAKRVAKALAARHFLPHVLIHSGAARAKETAEIFAAEWRSKVELEVDVGLYDASVTTLLDRTRALADAHKCVGLVGHNPGLGELATALTGLGAEPVLAPPCREISDRRGCCLGLLHQAMGRGRAQCGDARALPHARGTRGQSGLDPIDI